MEKHLYRFEITLKQESILLGRALFTWVGLILSIKFILKKDINDMAAIFIFPFIFLFDTLPSIIVYVQYWIKNHGAVLILNTDSRELIYEKGGRQAKYFFTDITSLQYFRNLGKGSGWNAFGQYRYYKIIFNDKNEIYITCLMINDIENTLERLLRITAERHAKLLCLIE
jgi:hypothetical protein